MGKIEKRKLTTQTDTAHEPYVHDIMMTETDCSEVYRILRWE
jgi:hypothetical protein